MKKNSNSVFGSNFQFRLYRICLAVTILLLSIGQTLTAQTIYVDVIKGRFEGKGTIMDPLSGLEQAVALASSLTGKEAVTIKIAPGLYVVSHILEIRTSNKLQDTARYTLEATVMPDDPDWLPSSMPVIQSVSNDNSITQFVHSAG